MADRIYLKAGDMPTGSLEKGKSKVDGVVSTLLPLTHQSGSPLDSVCYLVNGEYHRLFSNGAANMVANACAEMQLLQLQLDTYLAILKSGPDEFEQIDKAAKNGLTTWTDRTSHAISDAFSQFNNLFAGTFSFFLPKELTGAYMPIPGSSGQKQKSEKKREIQEDGTIVGGVMGGTEGAKKTADEAYLEKIRSMYTDKQKIVDARQEYGTGKKVVYKTETDKKGARKKSCTFNYTGGCTWYAANRYEQVNGEGSLYFRSTAGDAKNWDDAIDRDYFDVIDIDEETEIVPNTLAISDKGTDGTSNNHVCYVEAVDDEYVYYTEGAARKGEKDSNGNFHFTESAEAYDARADKDFGRVKRMKKDKFRKTYEHFIVAKENH